MERGRCDVVVPDDVAFGILVWLPVMSLLRFKSVCKSWFALIESSRFIIDHHANVKDEDDDIGTFIHRSEQTWKLMSCSSGGDEGFGFGDGEEDKYRIKILDLDLKIFKQNGEEGYDAWLARDHLVIESCYHGVILLHEYLEFKFGDIALLNPATKQLRQLPESQAPSGQEFYHVILGFGFDSKTNDYKVVKISRDFNLEPTPANTLIEVYSLSTNSWRITQALSPVDYILLASSPKQPYLDRFLCWVGFNTVTTGTPTDLMVSFDLYDEVFTTLPFPDVATDRDVGLAFLSGKVACFITICDPISHCIDHYQLWVLNEYGVKESWTKLCSIPIVYFPLSNTMSCIASPTALSKNGDFIFLSTIEQFYMFDPVTEEIDDLQIRAGTFDPQIRAGASSDLVLYKESLVSIQSKNDAADNTLSSESHLEAKLNVVNDLMHALC